MQDEAQLPVVYFAFFKTEVRMAVVTDYIDMSTKGRTDIIDVTERVQDKLLKSELISGTVTISCIGSTGGLTTVEYEPGLVKHDIEQFLESILPYSREYAHHKTWHDHNGYGHVRSFLIKTSQTFPFSNKQLILGTWQQIIFCEFDEKPRRRTIYCQIIGD